MNWTRVLAATQLTRDEDRCWSCGEPNPHSPWEHQCGECGHAWLSDDDLINHDQRTRTAILGKSVDRRMAYDIPACPCCAHDF